MKRLAVAGLAVAIVIVQAMFAFGSLSSDGYEGIAIAAVLLFSIWLASMACIAIARWLSTRRKA